MRTRVGMDTRRRCRAGAAIEHGSESRLMGTGEAPEDTADMRVVGFSSNVSAVPSTRDITGGVTTRVGRMADSCSTDEGEDDTSSTLPKGCWRSNKDTRHPSQKVAVSLQSLLQYKQRFIHSSFRTIYLSTSHACYIIHRCPGIYNEFHRQIAKKEKREFLGTPQDPCS